jgi:hypothetical protein
MPGMNEPQRLSYLQAMGIDSYVSRAQLPGAAQTRRAAIVRELQVPPSIGPSTSPPMASQSPPLVPRIDSRVESKPMPSDAPASPRLEGAVVRFNLAAVFVGGVVWLESLDGRPLAREQVKLIHAMARAIRGDVAAPSIAQFDWPMHTSRQLDQGADAAKDALAAFILRHAQEQQCEVVVALGETAAGFIDSAQLATVTLAVTRSTFEMLEDPACKRQVWSDLQSLTRRA